MVYLLILAFPVTSLMKLNEVFPFALMLHLDMRMDQRQTITAADVLKNFTEQQLHKMFEQYGEVTNAKTLAKTIVAAKSIDSHQNHQ